MTKTMLRELREEKKLNQIQLAKILGVSNTTVCGWETDYREMDYATLIKVCDYFNVSIDYLLKRKDY